MFMALARKSLPYAPWLLGMMISTVTMGMTTLVASILGGRSNVSVETSRRLGGGVNLDLFFFCDFLKDPTMVNHHFSPPCVIIFPHFPSIVSKQIQGFVVFSMTPFLPSLPPVHRITSMLVPGWWQQKVSKT